MKKKQIVGFVGAGMMAFAFTVRADVGVAQKEMNVDGRLDEPCWTAAQWESGFMRFNTEKKKGRTPVAQTEFAVLADAEALYVGIRAHHAKMDEMKTLPPASVWYDENVELYFAPDGGAFEFYQFLIAFDGRQCANFYSEGGNIQPDPYGPVWESKAVETPEGWTAEARIPLSAFYMTRNGAWKDAWKVNVGRHYRAPGGGEFSCWVDGNGYRDLKKYRTIGGFPKRRIGEDVWVKSAVVHEKGPKDGRLVGTVDFTINVAKGGEFSLESGFSAPKKVNLKAGDNVVTVTLAGTDPGLARARHD